MKTRVALASTAAALVAGCTTQGVPGAAPWPMQSDETATLSSTSAPGATPTVLASPNPKRHYAYGHLQDAKPGDLMQASRFFEEFRTTHERAGSAHYVSRSFDDKSGVSVLVDWRRTVRANLDVLDEANRPMGIHGTVRQQALYLEGLDWRGRIIKLPLDDVTGSENWAGQFSIPTIFDEFEGALVSVMCRRKGQGPDRRWSHWRVTVDPRRAAARSELIYDEDYRDGLPEVASFDLYVDQHGLTRRYVAHGEGSLQRTRIDVIDYGVRVRAEVPRGRATVVVPDFDSALELAEPRERA